MASLWKYIAVKWRKLFAITPEEKYPAMNNIQKEYREEFGGIVDQYLISYSSDRAYKLTGTTSIDQYNAGQETFHMHLDDAVMYVNPYFVVTPKGYTKHYYNGKQRIAAQIGGIG